MKKRTVYRVGYAYTLEGIGDLLSINHVLPEDIVEIRHDGNNYSVLYVDQVIDE